MKIRDIVEAAIESYLRDAVAGIDELLPGEVDSIVDNDLHEGAAGDAAKISAEGLVRHIGHGSGFLERDPVAEIFHDIGYDCIHSFFFGVAEVGEGFLAIEECVVGCRGKGVEDVEEGLHFVKTGVHGMKVLHTFADGVVFEMDPVFAIVEEALDGAKFGAGKEVGTEEVVVEMNHDRDGVFCIGGIGFPAMREIGSEKDEVAWKIIAHMRSYIAFAGPLYDQGEFEFGMKMKGCRKGFFGELSCQEGGMGRRTDGFEGGSHGLNIGQYLPYSGQKGQIISIK